ncbi:MAG: hypothetical protein Q9217_006457 [Psora testacea]
MPIDITYGWHFQYLTTLGLLLSMLTFFFAFSADLLSLQTSANDGLIRQLRTAKETTSCVAVPAEVLITSLYFGLRTIKSDLVIPDWAQLPLILDLSLHLTPTLFQLVDFLCFSPQWVISEWQALHLSTLLACLYWVWIEKCRKMNGFYAYPIFEEAGFYGRIGLFSMSAVLMVANTVILKWLHGTRQRAQSSEKKD